MLSMAYKMLYFSLQELPWLYCSCSDDMVLISSWYIHLTITFLLPESLLKAVEQTVQIAFSRLVCTIKSFMLGDFVSVPVKKLSVFHCTVLRPLLKLKFHPRKLHHFVIPQKSVQLALWSTLGTEWMSNGVHLNV